MAQIELSDDGTLSPDVIALEEAAEHDSATVGAKAVALATARQAGLPVLDGFVLSTAAVASWPGNRENGTLPAGLATGALSAGLAYDLYNAWHSWGRGRALVVRSSSPNEDGSASSLAGQFRSVLDVRTWERFLEAVDEVVASAGSSPMAVLVQPFLRPITGGVLFGADPVTGRRDRLVVAAVPGGPHQLVSGTETGTQLVLSRKGRIVEASANDGQELLSRSVRRSLARMARQAADLFGGPQDIEWAIEPDGSLVLLQSRPITAIGDEAEPDSRSPVLGPGPVAETFPAPLSPLEVDLWIPPLREGLRRALRIIGVVPSRKLRSSPTIVTVDGRPAIDLDLIGASPVRPSAFARLDPRPPARRTLAAWRLGRLRAALPTLASDLVQDVDADLRALPALDSLSAADLLRLLDRSAGVLQSLHGYEILVGQLLSTDAKGLAADSGTGSSSMGSTAASRALLVLAAERVTRPKATDQQLIAEHPVLLSLTAPAIRDEPALPVTPSFVTPATEGGRADGSASNGAIEGTDPDAEPPWRESLRLRIRWVHELMARAARTLGDELVRRRVLARPEDVAQLPLAALRDALVGRPVDVANPSPSVTTPLPRAFRQLASGAVVPLAVSNGRRPGQGAGGGRGVGRVHIGQGPPPPGAVLVVRTLDPALAPLLPGLAGLVSETGSVLSHLAILARERGIPTVVDLPGAQERYANGSWIVVDGATGEVSEVECEEWRAA